MNNIFLFFSVVHSGYSSDGGHYYTYARETMTSAEADLETYNKTSSWYVFNDSKVSLSSFESFKSVFKRSPRDTAYVLFYEKDPQNSNSLIQPAPSPSVPKLNSEVELNVENDNAKFLRELKCDGGPSGWSTVAKMSEDEQIKFALEQSLNDSKGTEDEQMEFALDQSLLNDSKKGDASVMTEKEQMEFALNQSLSNDSKEGDVSEMTEEEQIRLAIEQSLEPER